MKVSIIGAGNLAWNLARALERADYTVNEVYARRLEQAQALTAKLYDAEPVDSLNFEYSESDLFFVCVSDDAIPSIINDLYLPKNAIVVHTSGAKSMSLFNINPLLRNFGVFYPLQTFSKEVIVDFKEVPICLEANSSSVYTKLEKVAKKLSRTVASVSTHQRLVLHVGAVFSCNFTNHLWAVSKEILASEDLDFELLKPLIRETTNKMLGAEHPAFVQTGPAVRNDLKTIKAHSQFLADDVDLLKVYTTLSESISDWHRID